MAANPQDNVQDEIVNALARIQDQDLKALLLIMRNGFDEVKSEIRRFSSDIPWLRETVLNGHAPVHHDDHEWIAEQRAKQDKRDEYDAWCEQQIKAERDRKEDRRKITVGLIERVLWLAVVFFLAAHGIGKL